MTPDDEVRRLRERVAELEGDFREAVALYIDVPNGACVHCWEGRHDDCNNREKPMLPAADEQVWRGGVYGSFVGRLCPCRYGSCGVRALAHRPALPPSEKERG